MESISSLLIKVRSAKGVYIIGNGGSYANAQHIANDLLACGIRAFTLDPATLTAFANDFGYETVFARWIESVADKGDLLIALSGSGTSKNIVAALRVAAAKGMETSLISDYLRTRDMQQSEEDQIVMGHALMKGLRGA